jgi:DeoR/GlpR family transcriptional regulator of sugar metabolism
LAEKEAIARCCAELIPSHRSVIIDAGTTAYHVARHLESRKPQLITNSLPVANFYAANSQVEVVLSGGVIYPRLGVLVGPIAVESLGRMHADVAVMGAGGITPEGITNSHGLLIELQRAMLKAAQQVIFCLDHTKFGRKSMSFLCELSSAHLLVTDSAAPLDGVERLRAKGLQVIVAPED